MEILITPAAMNEAAGTPVKVTGNVEGWLKRLSVPTSPRLEKDTEHAVLTLQVQEGNPSLTVVESDGIAAHSLDGRIGDFLQQDSVIRMEQPELYLAEEQLCALYKNPPVEWDELMVATRKVYKTADLLIDETARVVYREGKILNMGLTEFNLLCHMVKHNTICCSRNSLMIIAEGRYNRCLIENTLTKHINRLRQRLGRRRGGYIHTNNGQGYKWIPKVERFYISR